ncbi:MAG: CYTH domain-containing protein [Gammaproteobacteria bacterium]|nr:CYTH domain-containing protein [Gammaproteobacteria bacterium]NNF62587.1 CYTH domain-containing protein [Gammaproteobacteria bacterium]NNM19845.1 CYTH domain-containing protein [Gammaproteobacteria bacterium]
MAQEIERKFLVADDSWRAGVERTADYRQGYLANTDRVSVRVRIGTDAANLNFKSATLDIVRDEYEYPIPLADAGRLLGLCAGSVVEKTRHFVTFAGHLWEVDEFRGANAGLVVAEIELDRVDERFERPPWLGAEVSHDLRYYNVSLAQTPYREWPATPAPDAS